MGLTYRDAGVDIDVGNELVRRIAPSVARARRPEQLSGLGGFAALAALPAGYAEPVLATCTDGVGTKLRLAIDHQRHDGVGQDLVAMCVNDLLVTGAEPFLFLDYYAAGVLDVAIAERVVAGIARACELAGCALAGGETAEMPGFHRAGDFELAGFCVGVVERSRIVSGERIEAGDVLLGLASSGCHANGYSLVRRILADRAIDVNEALLDDLLAPTRIYVRAVLPLVGGAGAPDPATRQRVKGMSHITGGGFVDNLPRMFSPALAAHLDMDAWPRPSIFPLLQQAGNIDDMEMLRTFNNGIGFVLCAAPEDADDLRQELADAGEQVYAIGRMATLHEPAPPGTLVVSAESASLGH